MTSKRKLEIEKITFGNATYNRRECISECKKGYVESYSRCRKIKKDDVADDDEYTSDGRASLIFTNTPHDEAPNDFTSKFI